MRAPNVRGAMQSARVAAAVASVAAPSLKRIRFIAPLARRSEIWWWEFESDVKRRLALEILMRRLFLTTHVDNGIST
jgi:hypothetical protein